jgi:uncharacterized protein with PIN domain
MTLQALQERINTITNMMIDNERMSIYPTLAMCFKCGFAPVRKLKVTIYAPRQSYHCPACKRSYWVPVSRKGE